MVALRLDSNSRPPGLKILDTRLNTTDIPDVPPAYESAVYDSHPSEFCSTQVFQEVPSGQPSHDAVGRPIPHMSAKQQVTGEAKYVDDLPKLEGELYLAFVFSRRPHAKIISMDVLEALALPGVEDVITAADVPGSNLTAIYGDEELFAVDKVISVGQVVAIVAATNQNIAQRAAKLVKVEYEDLDSILTIQEAIKEESFLHPTRTISVGDLKVGFEKSDHILEGECHVGAQEHFYLETMASIIIPKGENSEMEIISSTQNATKTQRLGGGFGGKELRCCILSAAAAVAANKVDKPVRYMFDRDEDMISTGTRHPFLGRYIVGFTKKAKPCLRSIFVCKLWVQLGSLFFSRSSSSHLYRWICSCHSWGIEMGQGLHTKIIQIASRALRIPKELIHVSETSTDKVPNSSPSAASASSDLNGMAVQRACETLLQRLQKHMMANPKGDWKDWVNAAYMDRENLSATGFHNIRFFVLIEGAFVQGYGLFVLEDYRYSPTGHLLTKGPGFYKIPGFSDALKSSTYLCWIELLIVELSALQR
ncbi:putative xanthine dehydrogenase/oxidase [Apostichopus japonicus]|uniref:Putative xanthine dehydrogenase/oxidase n=1 Tax=Stichopus japonicus TaxID=307972 RepID=A0A2G8LJA9_STIJA|nr:putative xanthine dehydrogenase/oxidase [Apostichopus japonicus]